jgi:hypothetical protein
MCSQCDIHKRDLSNLVQHFFNEINFKLKHDHRFHSVLLVISAIWIREVVLVDSFEHSSGICQTASILHATQKVNNTCFE